MSIRAMSWALKDAPVSDPVAHLILIGLADHAEDDGSNARPSQALLADYAHVSVRTVGYKIKKLSEDGIILRGDQQQVAHLRADRRPTVWDLNLNMVRAQVLKQRTHDLQNLHTDAPGSYDLQPVADRKPDDLQNLQTVEPNGLQNLQTDEDVEVDGLQMLQTVAVDGLQHLQTVAVMEDDGLQGVAGREPTACKLLQTEPSLTTSTKVDVVGHLSNARENPHLSAEQETTTTITENSFDPSRDVAEPLRSHLIPGTWSPSPQAWEEAQATCTTINLRLHLARYNVVKREKKQTPSNAEWLRWAIQDESNAQAELRKEAKASRQERPWYGVAD